MIITKVDWHPDHPFVDRGDSNAAKTQSGCGNISCRVLSIIANLHLHRLLQDNPLRAGEGIVPSLAVGFGV